MPLNMKTCLMATHDVFDVNQKLLPKGKYYFNILFFTDRNTLKGNVVKKQSSEPYEFRFFSFLTLLVKAQSHLARLANITDSRMPMYNSPVFTKKRIARQQCSICLLSVRSEGKYSKKLDCGHVFHTRCIKKWANYNKSCPNCRDLFQTLNLGKK